MSSNDDSPVPQPHSAGPDFSSISSKNSKPDTVDALLRIIFKLNWKDWGLIAVIALCLIAHYISVAHSCPPLAVDIIKIITVVISVVFIFRKISSAYKSKESIISFFEIHPIQLFVSIIACGATVAFFLPLILNISKFIGETDKLTTALLASTGGVIAVFTLIKTHQKNQNDEMSLQLDREKYEQQKEDRLKDIEMQNSQMKEQKRQFNKKTKQEAYRSHQEQIRQIHAERRSRYTKAVEQLANENAAVRLGGIYTLAGLVDEWLTDKSLKEESDRRKEGQVIINNLCAYIRSPFPLAVNMYILQSNKKPRDYKGDYLLDQVKLREEQDIRLTIIKEIKDRLSSNSYVDENHKKIIKKGPWSCFSYDFSATALFYEIDLRESYFEAPVNFSNTHFNSARFAESVFASSADFSDAFFDGYAEFTEAEFTETGFNIQYFIGAHFKGNAIFTGVTFNSDVHFGKAKFFEQAIFSKANFYGTGHFPKTVFEKNAIFSQANFLDGQFSETIFSGGVSFENAFLIREDLSFIYTDISGTLDTAKFSYLVTPEEYNFEIDSQPISRKIETEKIKVADGRVFTIPVGCELFDPNPLPAPKPEEKPAE